MPASICVIFFGQQVDKNRQSAKMVFLPSPIPDPKEGNITSARVLCVIFFGQQVGINQWCFLCVCVCVYRLISFCSAFTCSEKQLKMYILFILLCELMLYMLSGIWSRCASECCHCEHSWPDRNVFIFSSSAYSLIKNMKKLFKKIMTEIENNVLTCLSLIWVFWLK